MHAWVLNIRDVFLRLIAFWPCSCSQIKAELGDYDVIHVRRGDKLDEEG